jgi:hypothetical protein
MIKDYPVSITQMTCQREAWALLVVQAYIAKACIALCADLNCKQYKMFIFYA